MSFRCGERSGRLRCSLGPQHTGMHAALIRLDGDIGIVNWGLNEPEPVVEPPVVIEQEVGQESWARQQMAAHDRVSPPQEPIYRTMGFAGVRPTRDTLRNLYAGFDEGVHTCWGMFGHEVMPLPTLDEIEAVLV